jgi:hypothetical protein
MGQIQFIVAVTVRIKKRLRMPIAGITKFLDESFSGRRVYDNRKLYVTDSSGIKA